MKRCAALAILAGLFGGSGAGRTQQAFAIKLKERGEGEAAMVKRNERTSSKMNITDGMGQVLVDQQGIRTEIMEYKETILKREAGKQATKLQREYTKAQS